MKVGMWNSGFGMRVVRTLALVSVLAVSANAWAAKDDPDYDRLRGQLNQLINDRTLGSLAPAEISLAEQALGNLAEFGGKRKLHDHYVFLAERRIDIAYAAAQAVVQERKMQARLELERQRIQSAAQAEEAERLRAEADEARTQSEQTSKQAETAKKQAAQARRLADAQAREAELARKEAELLAASGAKPAAGAAKPAPTAAPAAKVAPITLGEGAFAPGQAVLKAPGTAQIGKIAAAAANKSVRIEAYANDGGNAKGNLALSQQRAQAIRDALVAAGVPAKRITTVGAGLKAGASRGAVATFSDH